MAENLKICALQLGTLPMSDSRIDYYLKLASDNGVSVVVLGEYVLNSFFNELKKMPRSMILEQSERKKNALIQMAKKYDLTIIAPIISQKGKELRKVIAKFSSQSVKYKDQNALISYSHWDERAFFASGEKLDIMSFSSGGIKFACIFGFEAHFDEFWARIREKSVDCVLIPSACALNSKERWSELLRIRAWLNGVYILRVNRLGKTKFAGVTSEFYGDSMLISPNGEILNEAKDKEEMLLCEIDKKQIAKARNLWKFMEIQKELQKAPK